MLFSMKIDKASSYNILQIFSFDLLLLLLSWMAFDQKLYMTFDNYVWFYVYFVFSNTL